MSLTLDAKTSRMWHFLAFALVALGLVGFAVYAGTVTGYDTPDAGERADAIVILTGDGGRLRAGGDLLRAQQAPHLLISGVHPDVTLADIRTQTRLDDSRIDCCVTIGREAADTTGNARETAGWVQDNGYASLIVVTSDYHLPRSLLVMEAAMPDVELIPYPVRTTPPWRNPGVLRLWLQEYAKLATMWLARPFTRSRTTP